MKKDKEWLKEQVAHEQNDGLYFRENYSQYDYFVNVEDLLPLIDQLDEPEKPVIPQFVADFIRATKPSNSLRLAFEYIAQRKIDNYDDELALWIEEGNSELFASAWLVGYEVEKELLWEIPIPFTVTSDGRIQYLIYDPKARTYLASRKNGQLKKTFNAKDLTSVPTQYRHYAELCDFKKIEEETE